MEYRRLLKAVDRKPFVPFTIVFVDGERVLVPDTDHIVFVPNRSKIWEVDVVDDERQVLVAFEDVAVRAIEVAHGDGKRRPRTGSS